MPELRLRSSDFRRERERLWSELEALVEQADRRGLKSLSTDDLHRLPSLYRAAVSSLGVARSISLDRNLLEYLGSLVARAYFCVYGVRPRAGRLVVDFFRRTLPGTVRKLAAGVILALVVMAAGTLVGLSYEDPQSYYAIVPDQMAQGRTPTSTDAELREALYSGQDQQGEELGLFATFLFTHNAKIGLLSFALGFALGLPVLLLLFYNGLILGAMAGLYGSRGLGLEFWAWVLPHGVTELLAVGLCGGAGLAVALAILRPGRYGRMHALSQTGRQASLIVLGAVLMFLLAGIIEGVLRQLITQVPTRLAMGASSALFWLAYLASMGRAARRSGPTRGDPV